MRSRLTGIGILAVAAVVFGASSAEAVPLAPFTCITNNVATNCGIGTSQLSGDLTGNMLTIKMTGSIPAVVKQLSIEGAGVTSLSFVSSTAFGTVAFGAASAGGNLPGGNSLSPPFMEAFTINALSPAPPLNGIGFHNQDQNSPQEGKFMLGGNLTGLRIGVHVIGYDFGGSEAFVTTPIPEPSTLLLLASGLAGLGFFMRRRKAA